jgi:hypothetical protein
MSLLNTRIVELVYSSDSNDKLASLWAIYELTDEVVPDNEVCEDIPRTVHMNPTHVFGVISTQMKISRFASYIRAVPTLTSDPAVLRLSAKALGHLAKAGGNTTTDFVEIEAKRALEWVQAPEPRPESARRLAAVLVLRELALYAPTPFYASVSVFFAHVWSALCDPRVQVGRSGVRCEWLGFHNVCLILLTLNYTLYSTPHTVPLPHLLQVRESAARALGACLGLVAARKSRSREQW